MPGKTFIVSVYEEQLSPRTMMMMMMPLNRIYLISIILPERSTPSLHPIT